MKRILFVDDEPRILEGLQRMLRPHRREWEMVFALGGEAALSACEAGAFDVIVSDMRMPGMDGAELLEHVQLRSPSTVRIILSGYSDTEAAMRATRVAHQFLSKPCNAATLKQAIDRSIAAAEACRPSPIRDLVGGVESLPVAPQLYVELSGILSRPDPSIEAVVELLARDPGIAAKLLQLVNSSFFGRGRRVTTVRGTVDLLGIRMVRNLVLATEMGRGFSGADRVPGFSVAGQQEHSLQVAGLAMKMSDKPQEADDAFAVGVLHDAGKLVLADRIPAEYADILSAARYRKVPLHELERERIGTSHAEVGAYLLGLWNLPESILSAVAHHHTPGELTSGSEQRLATVIHVADALVHETNPSRHVPLDVVHLHATGMMMSHLPRWRELHRTISRSEEVA